MQLFDLLKVIEITQEATVSIDAPEISVDAAGAASLSALVAFFTLKVKPVQCWSLLVKRFSNAPNGPFLDKLIITTEIFAVFVFYNQFLHVRSENSKSHDPSHAKYQHQCHHSAQHRQGL